MRNNVGDKQQNVSFVNTNKHSLTKLWTNYWQRYKWNKVIYSTC